MGETTILVDEGKHCVQMYCCACGVDRDEIHDPCGVCFEQYVCCSSGRTFIGAISYFDQDLMRVGNEYISILDGRVFYLFAHVVCRHVGELRVEVEYCAVQEHFMRLGGLAGVSEEDIATNHCREVASEH